MMRTAVALRHVHFEDLGLIEPLLRRAGYHVRYVEAASGDVGDIDTLRPDLLIILGGPVGVYEEHLYPFLTDELRLIERRMSRHQPVLGICLGAQLMARALGARVYAGPVKEIGWGAISLSDAGRGGVLASLADGPVLHWHGDTFDLPEGATHLASNDQYQNQAFSYGATALALQFHAEMLAEKIDYWLIGHAAEIGTQPAISVEGLRGDTASFGTAARLRGEKCFDMWLDLLQQDGTRTDDRNQLVSVDRSFPQSVSDLRDAAGTRRGE